MIKLPIPPSTNELYRGRRYKTNEYKAWQGDAAIAIYNQTGTDRITGPVVISIKAPENRRRDIDNYCKPVLDHLVTCGLIESDRCKIVRGISAVWHDGPDVEVTIERAAVI